MSRLCPGRSAREALDAVTPHIDATPPAGLKVAPAGNRPPGGARSNEISRRSAAADVFIRSAAGIFSAAACSRLLMMGSTPVRAARSCFRQAIVSMSGLKSLDMERQVRTRPEIISGTQETPIWISFPTRCGGPPRADVADREPDARPMTGCESSG